MVSTQGAVTRAAPRPGGIPERAGGVQLLGEMEQSGFKEPPCLVCRGDGQTIQLTDLLYRVLEAIDGRRDLEAVAAEVTRAIGKEASADDIRFLIDEKLRPLGLLKGPDGADPEVDKPNPLLALRFRVVLSDERTTRRITGPFARLFVPPVVLVVVVGFAAMVGWLLFSEGVGGGTRQMIYQPGLLVLVFVLAVMSAGFHEFGHAAALRYGGGVPRAMGAGLYLVWPAFYTDVTDSYRLPRRARLRTDLGGLYFNMVFALATFAAWRLTGFDALLVVIPLQLLQMAQQLLPIVRLDGYHILADLTGVPDLFSRIRPTIASLRPGTPPDQRVTALKPWVRMVVTLWVLAVVPLLLFALVVVVVTFPRLAATAWDSLGLQRTAASRALDDGDALALVARSLSIAALCLPVAGTLYQVARVGGRSGRWLWRGTEGRPLARAAAGVALAAVVAGLAVLWWPNGEYRPLQPGERGRVQDTVAVVRHVRTGRPALTPERAGELRGAPFQSGVTDPALPGTTTGAAEEPAPTTATTPTTPPSEATPAYGDHTSTSTTATTGPATSATTTTTSGTSSTTATTTPETTTTTTAYPTTTTAILETTTTTTTTTLYTEPISP